MKELEEKILNLKRQTLAELLLKCTSGQVGKFNRIFPGGEVPEDRLLDAINLVNRTVKKNEEAGP